MNAHLRLCRCIVVLVAIAPVIPAEADVVTLPASKDNTLYETATGSLSNGAGEFFFIGRNNAQTIRRGVLAFDVASAIPAGSTITSVTLTLHLSQASIPTAYPTGLHRLLADWGEGSSDATGTEGGGAPPAPGDATWLHTFFPSSFWSTPGGDLAAVPSAVIDVGEPAFYSWTGTTALIADVQSWLDSPASNFGWAVRGNEVEGGSAKRFDSRQNANPAFHPALTIEYLPIPEPATLAGMAFAGLAVLRRGACARRRLSIAAASHCR